MEHKEFAIGATFWCGGGLWRCTDIGTRVIIATGASGISLGDSIGSLKVVGYVGTHGGYLV